MRELDPAVAHIGAGETLHGFCGGFYMRPFGPFARGDGGEGHAHYIDHATLILSGRVLIEWRAPDGRSGRVEVDAPNFVPIKAEYVHTFTALTDGASWCCVFAEAEAALRGDVPETPAGEALPVYSMVKRDAGR